MRLRRAALAVLVACGALLGGCVVVTVASTAVGLGVDAAGLAVDVGVGAAKLTGKAVGAAVDAASGSDDHSGVNIRFREPTAADREKRRLAEQQAEDEDRRAAQGREPSP